jgi:HEAT repeat protein
MDVETLFGQTLSGEYDDDEPWKAVSTLQQIGSREVFDTAALWCRSQDVLKRARGADVLAQLGKTADHPTNSYPEESFAIMGDMAATDLSCLPLKSAIFALGHIGDSRAVPIIAEHGAHPDPDVRFAVACACGSLGNEQQAVEMLLRLMRDDDSDVRDWATFGIGSLSELDTPAIRNALINALDDSDADVRGEALVGLGRRRDINVLPHLLAQLQLHEVDDLTIEAACEMLELPNANPSWSPSDYVSALGDRFR